MTDQPDLDNLTRDQYCGAVAPGVVVGDLIGPCVLPSKHAEVAHRAVDGAKWWAIAPTEQLSDDQIRAYLDQHPERLRAFLHKEARIGSEWLRAYLRKETRIAGRFPFTPPDGI